MKEALKNLDHIITELWISLEKASCINDMILDDILDNSSDAGGAHSYTDDIPFMILDDYLKQCKIEAAALDDISDTLKQMQPQGEAE